MAFPCIRQGTDGRPRTGQDRPIEGGAALRFLHAADLHLDSPFRGLSQVSEAVAARMRDATLRTLDRLADEARRAAVDCVLLAGDTYDGADRGVRAQVRLRDALAALAADGIESLMVLGNHDPADGWALDLAMPGVHVFPPGRPGGRDVVVEGRTIGHVDGISYPTREVRENYAARLRRHDDAPVSVALLHANVGGGATGHADYAPARLEDLEASGHDYWALGHVHNRRVLRAEGPVVVYPGNPQGRSMRETGVRGAYVVTMDGGRPHEVRFVPLCDVVFDRVDVDLAPIRGAGDLPDLLLNTLSALRAEAGAEGRARVVRLVLQGEAPAGVRDLLSHSGRRRDLLALLQEEADAFLADALVWPEGIEDATPAASIDAAAGLLLADVLDLADRLGGEEAADEALRADARRMLGDLFDQPVLRRILPDLGGRLPALGRRAADRLARDLGGEEAP